jgi:protein-glutamine gamma-glutamyltransferase
MPVADALGRSTAGRGVDRLFQFCLLGMVGSGYFAVAGSGYLDASTVIATAVALLLRALIVVDLLRIPFSPAMVNIATLAYIGFYPLDYLYVSKEFLPATVHLVFFLAIAKILTADNDRDYTYIKVIAFLELLAACLLSGRLNFFGFLAMYLLFAVGAFSISEIRRSIRANSRVVRAGLYHLQPRLIALSIFISIGVLSITGGLFFFLPRTARAAFQHLISERYHLPGFANEITLGQLGEIKAQSTTIMHVRFLSPSWPSNLKWRGTALNEFDGKRWYNNISPHYDPIRIERSGLVRLIDEVHRPTEAHRFVYEVHEKDFGSDTLFFAGVPEFLSINVPVIRRSESNGIRLPLGLAGGVSYIAHAYIEPPQGAGTAPDPLDAEALGEYLQLPPLDPRIPRLAAKMTAGVSDPAARAGQIEHHLRSEYGYTLKLLSHEVADPLSYFLFDRKQGHCEYFASAMAVMLRTLGIPSRVVTGFQSGIFNPISGLQVIRTSDAHSWVEAYLPHRGWTTFDPTPADPFASASGLSTRISLYLDAAETFWQDWVLNYDLDRQLLLATRMQESNSGSSWAESVGANVGAWWRAAEVILQRYGPPIAAALISIAMLVLYGPAVRKAWKMRQRLRRLQAGAAEASDATLLYNRMLRVLERRGFEKPAWVTPLEFARKLPVSDFTPLIDELTAAYHELRYGGRPSAALDMLSLLERLEQMR